MSPLSDLYDFKYNSPFLHLTFLKIRGLKGVDLITSDSHAGLIAAIKKVFQNVAWQKCQFHFTRNILDKASKKYQAGLGVELRDMFNSNTLKQAVSKRNEILEEYRDVAPIAMETLEDGFLDSMNIMSLPYKYRQTLRNSNLLERENQELRKREKVIKVFPNTESGLRLMGAVLMDHHDDWSTMSGVFLMTEYLETKEQVILLLRIA